MERLAMDETKGVVRVTFYKGKKVIRVEQIDEFGKRPSLWIGTENEMIKVASFGSVEKSELFCEWMAYIFFNADELTLKLMGLKQERWMNE